MASVLVRATAAVGSLAHSHARGQIDDQEFADLSMVAYTEVAVVAVCSSMGQATIPIPMLGAVVGALAGRVAIRVASKLGSDHCAHVREIQERRLGALKDEAEQLYRASATKLDREEALLAAASDPRASGEARGTAAMELARSLGVPDDELLHDLDELKAYLLE
jgi:alkylhydroperoxidase family enzyme